MTLLPNRIELHIKDFAFTDLSLAPQKRSDCWVSLLIVTAQLLPEKVFPNSAHEIAETIAILIADISSFC
ncbi:hypothetical protein VNO78_03704 [Psophocarpus tetragonolobus]|uniref:Uncharacterized protein n=1 Tax=Psophocarpus tetragonolobus TaxID=3891 RepID=A0AAN9T1Y8_PSOTE